MKLNAQKRITNKYILELVNSGKCQWKKNCTFSTDSAPTIHGNTSNNNQTNYISSPSHCLSSLRVVFFFYFPPFFSFHFNFHSFFVSVSLFILPTVVYVYINSITPYISNIFVTFLFLGDSYRMGGNSILQPKKKNYPFQQLNLKLWYALNWAKKTQSN